MTPRLLAASLLFALPAAQAATYTVTRFDDPLPNGCLPADCSLREAVNAANATTAADTIVLGVGDYRLTRVDSTPDTPDADRGALHIAGELTVRGAGTSRTRVAWDTPAAHQNGVFRADRPAPLRFSLQLSNLVVANGRGFGGGCIHVSSDHVKPPSLLLDRVIVEHCVGTQGGAIYQSRGELALRSSSLRYNEAMWGGAMDLVYAVRVDTQKADIHDNHATHGGGGVRMFGMPIVPVLTEVTWMDDGYSRIRDNTTDGRGGGVLVDGPVAIDIATTDASPATRLLTLSRNRAADAGGGIYFGGYWNRADWTDRLHRVRIEGNTAREGGGVLAVGALNLSDSEIVSNIATGGNGGGIAYTGSAEWLGLRALARVSVRDNQAMSGVGGGLSTECTAVMVDDSAFSGNRAGGSRGQGIDALATLDLRHVTLSGNGSGAANSPGLRKRYATDCSGHALRYANSLIADACAAVVQSELVSSGGNQLGPAAGACPALVDVDQRQSQAGVFGLVPDVYGGDFLVPGWPSDAQTRPQRNFGRADACSAVDIRGAARSDGGCDAGAFEQ